MRRVTVAAALAASLAAAGCYWDPSTPLARAAVRGNVREMQALIAKGADLEEGDLRGLTALIAAARRYAERQRCTELLALIDANGGTRAAANGTTSDR